MTQSPASRHNARGLQAGHPADTETNNDAALLDRREIRGQKLRCAAAQALSSLDCAYSRSDGKLLIVGQTVGQRARTVADVSDSRNARHVLLARIPYRRFCPDTEEVTGSNPVSPTSNIPGQTAIATARIACVIDLASQTASLTDQLDGAPNNASMAVAPRVNTRRSSLR